MVLEQHRAFRPDPSLFPFESRWFESGDGKMHYVDVGSGPTILFVHGTPTWSFLYRRQIEVLSKSFRCVAVDHLGFGLSDKPAGAPLRPEDHARRLGAFVRALGLSSFDLVVHDFGGPIGLSLALDFPERVRRLAILNTWMWSNEENPEAKKIARTLRGPMGSILYLWFNFSAKYLLKMLFADKRALAPAVHRHYLGVFPDRHSRQGPLELGRSLDSPWFGTLWERRASLADKPLILIWGMKDKALTETHLDRWREFAPHAPVVRCEEAGHFPQEEAADAVSEALRGHFSDENSRSGAAT